MEIKDLEKVSKKLRLEAVRMVYEAKDGHPGPALSIADIMTTLYFSKMRINPDDPDWEDRDRLILSKGHSCPILYAALAEKGYFHGPVEHFHLRALGSNFQGHPVMKKLAGIDFTSGSLGNGIAIGAGMAVSAKHQKKDFTVFVIVGDGEMQEGIVWEGINFAAASRLDNLIVFVDKNDWQSGGRVDDIIGANNVAERFAAFNWHTQEICGHDFSALGYAIDQAKAAKGQPSVIVCNDVKGKGLPFMEDDNAWHKGVPSDAQFQTAVHVLGGKN